MKKPVFVMSALMLASVGTFVSAQESHPWLEARLKEQRYPCPPGKSPVRGPADAQVTIVEFLDFDCPYCKSQEPIMQKVLAAYPTQVRVVFKNLPLGIHPGAKDKAVLAECMGIQGKFWQAYDQLLAGVQPNKVKEGVDKGKLNACISQGGEGQVDADLALAKHLGLATTPSFVVDGIRIGGTISFPQFKLLIDAELARKNDTK